MLISKLNEKQRELIGTYLRERMELHAMTQDKAAGFLDIDPRTLRKVLLGDSLTVPRLQKLAELLDFDLEDLERLTSSSPHEIPQESLEFGGYPFHSVERYIGDYIMVRHSLGEDDNLHCSLLQIEWSVDRGALSYKEIDKFTSDRGRPRDYSQTGMVFVSADIGLFHFMTKWRGALRLITASKLRPNTNMMYGLVLTQADQRFGYIPATSPIIIHKVDETSHPDEFESGPISSDHPKYNEWLEALRDTQDEIIIKGV